MADGYDDNGLKLQQSFLSKIGFDKIKQFFENNSPFPMGVPTGFGQKFEKKTPLKDILGKDYVTIDNGFEPGAFIMPDEVITEPPPKEHTELFTLELTRSFNSAAGHIEGHLTPMAAEEVKAVKDKFQQNIEKQVDAALKGVETIDKMRQALIDYAVACSRTREKPKAKTLKEKAQMDPFDLQKETEEILTELKEVDSSVKKSLNESEYSSRFENDPAMPMFKDQDRIYYRLEDRSVSSIEPFVRTFLERNGYEITDYKTGLASNDGGKNQIKIGKLLRKHEAPEGLADAYNKDPCRVQKNLMVVLTRNPVDIARGSHGRGWQSCRASASSAASNGVSEYYAGVVAAYLVTEDDPDIHDPLGRLYMKPFDTEESTCNYNHSEKRYDYSKPVGPTVYFTFNPIGLHFPAFADAVNRFADESFNQDHHGKFFMRNGCESYRENTKRTRLPQDAKAALKQLEIDFKTARDGKIIVDGDLNMAELGLHKLPDLTNVEVTGTMNVSDNKLLSLAGLPQSSVGGLKADRTLISSFHGCTPEIKGGFSYIFSAYLESTCGAPNASEYSYGGGFYDSNVTAAPRCISPMERPDSFARFKRR